MCSPSASLIMGNIISATANTANQITQYNQNKKINEYKTQIALNNIKAKQNQAKALQQEGIEESRDKRIDAIKDISSSLAKNSASGFSALSQTNKYNYEDIKNLADSNALDIQEKYNSKAQQYLDSANNSILNLKANNESYNSKQFNKMYTSLGNTTSVLSSWYGQGDYNVDF